MNRREYTGCSSTREKLWRRNKIFSLKFSFSCLKLEFESLSTISKFISFHTGIGVSNRHEDVLAERSEKMSRVEFLRLRRRFHKIDFEYVPWQLVLVHVYQLEKFSSATTEAAQTAKFKIQSLTWFDGFRTQVEESCNTLQREMWVDVKFKLPVYSLICWIVYHANLVKFSREIERIPEYGAFIVPILEFIVLVCINYFIFILQYISIYISVVCNSSLSQFRIDKTPHTEIFNIFSFTIVNINYNQ